MSFCKIIRKLWVRWGGKGGAKGGREKGRKERGEGEGERQGKKSHKRQTCSWLAGLFHQLFRGSPTAGWANTLHKHSALRLAFSMKNTSNYWDGGGQSSGMLGGTAIMSPKNTQWAFSIWWTGFQVLGTRENVNLCSYLTLRCYLALTLWRAQFLSQVQGSLEDARPSFWETLLLPKPGQRGDKYLQSDSPFERLACNSDQIHTIWKEEICRFDWFRPRAQKRDCCWV